MKNLNQEEKPLFGNVASLKFYHDWVNDGSLKQLDDLYTDFLSCLSGSGDSVFQILRPLEAVELIKCVNEPDFESLGNSNSDDDQSILSEDENETAIQHINIKSVEILSSATSESSLLASGTTNEKTINMDEGENEKENEALPDAGQDQPPEILPEEYETPAPEEQPQGPDEGVQDTKHETDSQGFTSGDEPTEVPRGRDAHRSSTVSNIPVTDSAVLTELKEADEKAVKTAKLIESMRKSIAVYNEKTELTEEDAKDFERMQKELMEKLEEFEDITRRVQQLVGLADLSSISLQSSIARSEGLETIPEQAKVPSGFKGEEDLTSPEDKLPKVVVCGMQDQVPRIIVCDGAKKNSFDYPKMVMSLKGRLNESYCLQERLASENANLEGCRYTLEEALRCRDNAVDCLQRKVGTLQTEMRIILKENSMLNQKLTQISKASPTCPETCPNLAYHPPAQGPGDTGNIGLRIQQYTDSNSQLENQLGQIEKELRTMQCEMGQIQRERNLLEEQKKMIKSPLTISTGASQGTYDTSCSAQLREIREKYSRLEDDFRNKVTECASLRNDNIQLKQIADAARKAKEAAEAAALQYEEKYKTHEVQNKVLQGSQEQMIEQEQQLIIARQRYREAQDELDDLRTIVHDQSSQLEEYRNKYLQAQEQVEEQRRNIELLEMDNARINEQVSNELQRVKAQFQEKMQELTPLPDLLAATQMKLKECQQLKAMADHNLELMARDLQEAKEEIEALHRDMQDSRTSFQTGSDEIATLKATIESWERKYSELKEENANLKSNLARTEEAASQNLIRLQEKLHEITQLTAQLETVREESARQVSRTKDRAEAMRRSMQSQISDIERDLAQSRASARTAQKERDEIRQRMQFQINNLTENFDQAQLRIRSLQSHVDYLKSSYNEMCAPETSSVMIADTSTDTCGCSF